MAKSCDSGWLGASKKIYGHESGGGSVGKSGKGGPAKGEFDRKSSKDGGIGKPTEYGSKSGGGKQPRGKDRPQNNPRGIGLKSRMKD